ncbi:peptidylprolyl isomerase [Amycolatopsis keratiniphila]|uniref:peptidylprolyl isomerase n=1 Tax=Amycolatopsis keratiniphila TaxID=129921 RepID=UPI00087CFBF2|nr:peptidylprolyl isomerase [Amycolatopsis keratiniphila]OLZ42948.1 parvulin peptidyl-prolyl isomerase [Amycolatopsis keratiniphila subsp. nogabecina]SDU66360.1 peptidyl-prolyl cis-trans isomerase C [Amycolatopsis keratiniphila]
MSLRVGHEKKTDDEEPTVKASGSRTIEDGESDVVDTPDSHEELEGPAKGDAMEDSSELDDGDDEPREDGGAEGGKSKTGLKSVIRAKLPKTRKVRLILLVVLLLLVGGGVGGYAWYNSQRLPDDAAFRVAGRVITTDQLSGVLETWRAMYGVQPPQDEATLGKFRKDSAKAYAVSLILQKAAQDRGIVIGDKVAQDALTRLISQQLGEGVEAHDKFVQQLGNVGTSKPAVIGEIKQQLALSQLFDAVTTGSGDVSEQEVKDAFATRKDQLGTPEQRKIGNIVVRTKEEAEQVIADLSRGAKFETVAQQRSIDTATRDKGGDLGAISRSQLQDDYGRAAFGAATGGVFGPVQNQFGWNVGRVNEVMVPVPATFEKAHDSLKQQLRMEKMLAMWRSWLGDQIKGAGVEYADEYRPDDPDAAPDVKPGGSPVAGQQGAVNSGQPSQGQPVPSR